MQARAVILRFNPIHFTHADDQFARAYRHGDALPVPPGYQWSLALLYSVYAICVVLLYFACRWYARIKRTRHSIWLALL